MWERREEVAELCPDISICVCPVLLVHFQVHHIFPHLKGCVGDVLAVPTIQHSRMDIVRMGAEVEEEKDRCLETVSLPLRNVVLIHFLYRRNDSRAEAPGLRLWSSLWSSLCGLSSIPVPQIESRI